MRSRHRLLGGTLLGLISAGCLPPRNSMPISTGVPDGFVLARELVKAPNPSVRCERVQFAYRNTVQRAIILTPWKGGPFPLSVIVAGSDQSIPRLPTDVVSVVVTDSRNESLMAGAALGATLVEVDYSRERRP